MATNSLRDWQMLKSDISFTLAGIFGLVGVSIDSFDRTRDAILPENPWLTAGVIVALAVLVGFLVTKVAAIDRRRSEEYTFQILSSAAVVAVITTLFVTFVWSSDMLLAPYLGEPTIAQVIAVLMGSWSVGYFIYRFRGVSE